MVELHVSTFAKPVQESLVVYVDVFTFIKEQHSVVFTMNSRAILPQRDVWDKMTEDLCYGI